MKTYLLNCDKLNFFKTFPSMDEVIKFMVDKNKNDFDGEPFSLFGRGQKEIINEAGDSEWVDVEYYIDSAVLCPKNEPNTYYTFFIRCIDSKGNIIEL